MRSQGALITFPAEYLDKELTEVELYRMEAARVDTDTHTLRGRGTEPKSGRGEMLREPTFAALDPVLGAQRTSQADIRGLSDFVLISNVFQRVEQDSLAIERDLPGPGFAQLQPAEDIDHVVRIEAVVPVVRLLVEEVDIDLHVSSIRYGLSPGHDEGIGPEFICHFPELPEQVRQRTLAGVGRVPRQYGYALVTGKIKAGSYTLKPLRICFFYIVFVLPDEPDLLPGYLAAHQEGEEEQYMSHR